MNSSALLPKFVQNRIAEIRRTPDLTLRYVPTQSSPADIATRGLKPTILKENSLWWQGPTWLVHERLWPAIPSTTELFTTNTVSLAIGIPVYSGFLTDCLEKRFSNWNSYVRVFQKVISFCFKQAQVNDSVESSSDSYEKAERLLILELQRKYFSTEYSKLGQGVQSNFQLELFLDDKGYIRCRGRLQNVAFPWDIIHPILLPRVSPLTEIYIRKVHSENHHIGCSHLLAKIRERVWVIKGRAKVKSVIHKCGICRRWSGKVINCFPCHLFP